MGHEQTMAALAHGNRIKRLRAAERHRIADMEREDGLLALAALVAVPPWWLEGERLSRLLCWPHRMGAARTRRLLVQLGGGQLGERRLRDLTDRQRRELTRLLGAPS